MFRNLLPLLLLVLCVGVASCAPSAIPGSASTHWDREWGPYWTWTRRFEHGCVEWTATDRWALVDLQIGSPSQCETTGEGLPPVRGAGISYASHSDEVIFRGWQLHDRMEMDGGGDPCPFQISEAQIAELRRVEREALALTETEGERRVLSRIEERLRVNGITLTTHRDGGCSDLTETERAAGPLRVAQDPWQGGR